MRLALAASLLALAGCSSPERDAAQAARAAMADPDSAQTTKVRMADDGLVCGLINARNAFGAYVGFQPFAYYPVTRVVILTDDLERLPPVCDDENTRAMRADMEAMTARLNDQAERLERLAADGA